MSTSPLRSFLIKVAVLHILVCIFKPAFQIVAGQKFIQMSDFIHGPVVDPDGFPVQRSQVVSQQWPSSSATQKDRTAPSFSVIRVGEVFLKSQGIKCAAIRIVLPLHKVGTISSLATGNIFIFPAGAFGDLIEVVHNQAFVTAVPVCLAEALQLGNATFNRRSPESWAVAVLVSHRPIRPASNITPGMSPAASLLFSYALSTDTGFCFPIIRLHIHIYYSIANPREKGTQNESWQPKRMNLGKRH